jgi:uncharacterized protein DUF1524
MQSLAQPRALIEIRTCPAETAPSGQVLPDDVPVRRAVMGVVGVLALVAGCGSGSARLADNPQTSPARPSTPSTSQTQVSVPPPTEQSPRTPKPRRPAKTTETPSHVRAVGAALALSVIAVKGRAPMTGYDRDLFGQAWSDDNADPFGHNGCDTRNDVLRRDLVRPVVEAGTHDCVVLSGVLNDPYTGDPIRFLRGETTSIAVQIDHVVALGDAWQTGAQQWSADKRQDFANDPLNLLAVDGPQNESKGDGDAATWLPPDRGFWCVYVARQVTVKAKYGLWMTAAEQSRIGQILAGCGAVPLAGEPGQLHPRTGYTVGSAPATTPPAPPPTTRSTPPPGGQCEPGYSPCLPIVDDLDCGEISDALKPIHVTGDDPYRLDADDDGLGCE